MTPTEFTGAELNLIKLLVERSIPDLTSSEDPNDTQDLDNLYRIRAKILKAWGL